ncbi:hypothetical protein QYF36_017758 [Acer negundo]|nr:hypothetical protein QYF36_017758 [Acer negundo]
MIREGRRSVGFDRWRDSRRLSGSSPPLPNFVTSKVSPSEAGGLTNGVAAAISERSSKSGNRDAIRVRREESNRKSRSDFLGGNEEAPARDVLSYNSEFKDRKSKQKGKQTEDVGIKTLSEQLNDIPMDSDDLASSNVQFHCRRSQLKKTGEEPETSIRGYSNGMHMGGQNSCCFSFKGCWRERNVTRAPRNGCGIPWNWSRIHHRGKTILDMAGRSLTSSGSSTKSDAEALPLLVDASGSLESTENAGWVHDYSGELGIFADHLLKHDVDLDLASEGRSGHQHKLGRNHKGKTSCARIFARALNCQSIEHPKPCGFCNSCVSHDMGKSRNIREVGPISNFDFESILDLLDNMVLSQLPSQHKIFVFDDCDTLSPDCWGAISKVIDRAPRRVVFILVSSNLDVLPHIIISRCQKLFFPKLKDADIIYTLQWIASKEDIEIDKDALNLIASRFDGSLRDAEMTLEQLSLVGQRISVPLVQELVILSNIVTRINTGAGFHAPLVLPASKDASRPGTLELGKRDARDGDTNGVSSQGQFLHSKSLEKGRCEIVELPATPKETKDSNYADNKAEYNNRGIESSRTGEASDSQRKSAMASTSERRRLGEQSQSQILARSKVSLAHVIQQVEGCTKWMVKT